MSSTTRTVLLSALNLLIVVIYAAGSSRWVSNDSGGWYGSLRRPAWQPPDPVFGIAWTYNFVMLAVVGVLVAAQGTTAQRATWLAVFAVSVAAALMWAWLFYERHQLWGAAVSLAAAALLTIVLTVVAWRVHWGLGVAMLPYAIWVCLATSLAVGYASLD